MLGRIGIGIALGILIGLVVPLWGARLMATFNAIFGSFLGFLIPLIIIGFVTPAIASIGVKAGRLLVVTAVLAYVATVFAGLLSYFTGVATFPWLISGTEGAASVESASPAIEPFFNLDIPSILPVMSALVLSFMMGLGICY